jgi:hypothetical protein
MSSLMRPSGPLPARVYWVRRLLVLAVVVLVVALVWWLLSSRGSVKPTGSEDPNASLSGLAATHAPAETPNPSAAPVTDHPNAQMRHTQHPRHARPHGHRKPGKTQQPLPAPTGDCPPADVAIAVSVPDGVQGQSDTATLSLTTLDGAVCTLRITPTTMVLRVTSGSDVLWTSDDCPNLLPAKQVVVRPDPVAKYRWTWDGRRSVQGCVSPGAVANPGGYWVEAALVGADVHKGYFDITG